MLPIQYASDIHLELREKSDRIHPKNIDKYFKFIITPKSPILCLAGDIGYPFNSGYQIFIDWCSKNFEQVFIIAGNHEYYQCRQIKKRSKVYNISEIDQKIQSIAELHDNVFYINNQSVKINYKNQDYVFIGSTLWSDIDDQTSKSLNDYNNIFIDGHLITASDIRDLFKINKKFLEDEIKKYDKNTKVVVMTHHLPSFHFLSSSSKNYEKGYASELEYLLQPPVVLWISGHDHNANKILQIGNGTTFAINCLGYPGQRTLYSRDGISI